MMMKVELMQSLGVAEKEEDEYENVSLLDESDIERNQAELEDFDKLSDLSFFGEEGEFKQPDWMHNSFTGGYSNIDDIHMDKGKTN